MRMACLVLAALSGGFFAFLALQKGYMELFVCECEISTQGVFILVELFFLLGVMAVLSAAIFRSLLRQTAGAKAPLDLLCDYTIGPLLGGLFGLLSLGIGVKAGTKMIVTRPGVWDNAGTISYLACGIVVSVLSLCLSLRTIRKAYASPLNAQPAGQGNGRYLVLTVLWWSWIFPTMVMAFLGVMTFLGPEANGGHLDGARFELMDAGANMNQLVMGITLLVFAFTSVWSHGRPVGGPTPDDSGMKDAIEVGS